MPVLGLRRLLRLGRANRTPAVARTARRRGAVRRSRGVTRQAALAGLQELLGPSVIEALGYAFTPTQLGNAGLAPQAIQHDADLLFRRMPFASCTADVLHDPLRRRSTMHGFLSHLHSLMVTMSQKSSVLKPLNLSHRR